MQLLKRMLQCSMLLLLGNQSLALYGKDKKSALSPALRRQVKAGNRSYKKCRLEALNLAKNGSLSPAQVKTRLSGCSERFPGASLYINCKRKATLSAKGNKGRLLSELKACKRLTIATSFAASEPQPFALEGGQLVFAGLGLNRTLPVGEVQHPSFNCKALQDAMGDAATKAEYLLFGNHPSLFKGFAPWQGRELAKKLGKGATGRGEDGTNLPRLGKLFGNAAKPAANLYFPIASCYYTDDLEPHYTGLSAYYLLDEQRRLATPYFASAFYADGFTALSSDTIAERLLAAINAQSKEGTYQAFAQGTAMTFLAITQPQEFDDEGDPRNVCRGPKVPEYLGVIRHRPSGTSKKRYPAYVLLAQTKHLCSYGDKKSAAYIRR